MVSQATDSAIKLGKQQEDPPNDAFETLSLKINQLKKQIQAERTLSIKEKLKKNGEKLKYHVSEIIPATSRRESSSTEGNGAGQMLSSRIEHPICKFNGVPPGSGDRDYVNSQDVVSTTITKLPYTEKLPPYTTWIFLDRNQRMAEDQSVVGRRRIYYDQHGSEALICSDSEEEIAEPEKHEFSEGEDRILWLAFQEHGLGEEVLNIVSQLVGGTYSEIQERYNMLKEKYREGHDPDSEGSGEIVSNRGISLEKSLSASLDSFDNLFCRRCMLFDCPLHGCSQALVYPNEKQSFWSEHEEDRKPCSDQCYLWLRVVKMPEGSSLRLGNKDMTSEEGERILATSNVEEPGAQNTNSVIEEEPGQRTPLTLEDDFTAAPNLNLHVSESLRKRKVLDHLDTAVSDLTLLHDDSQGSCKKHKKLSDMDVLNAASENKRNLDIGGLDEKKLHILSDRNSWNDSVEHASDKLVLSGDASCGNFADIVGDGSEDVPEEPNLKLSSNSFQGQVEGLPSLTEWKPMEKELYLKGIEIFGRNSCLIARNLLSGLKTCIEVSNYMHAGGASITHRSIAAPSSFMEESGKTDTEHMDLMPTRSRLLRRRGKTRKLKYSWKSSGHPSIWKRIANGKNQSCKQYTPCGCQSMCGKQCPCLNNGTCCEKYCGCSKSCKNRFRGCHCAKSQCKSRQCPCFAAGRECDPDVCRNCWVSCGDGSLGEPPRRGDGQCGNMKLLLRQQQRILLAKSDLAGWGAFLKNPVNKNDYLGEYTGELISHREADKRGKIYDRANSSFLFDLNDQYVLDAYRKGDKLKFANHSANPNCYAKVMLVAGDHRVGIFAKEHIDASEELFYDYCYGPDQAPVWARKPEGSKRDESSVSQGRAKKHQSHS
ncbi:Histone-lysine N-methyltransferase [Quillaja saponaria]|uniref:Histone-lysine N-methyltransferase n=1 Tax=Quillaja saponaria TaxID=32244 RepID=A0AAD7Q1I1_QUISA|nr:Histone-lysine N-methyltransferase [Quillaja saponaria]